MQARIHIVIRGAVQGVGFRPFIYRLATELHLAGWVANSPQGVFLEAEGEKSVLDDFLLRIEKEKPRLSSIQSLDPAFLDAVGYEKFEIRESDYSGETSAIVLPDAATCPDCLHDISDPSNRRYRYPFTNCTNCGPRFSIIESLPYDRPNTTMKSFIMCPECRKEYDDPADRRFHAQPNACPACGPHLELWDVDGRVIASHDNALREVGTAIRAGKIVAVKGIGGFQLIADARNEHAVVSLRRRKHREEKPFALMFPALDEVKCECEVSKLEERLLLSAESPIVLLNRKPEIANRKSSIASSVAPRNPNFGVMLPYSPLHHLLMRELGFPVVATSGNLSDEPMCTDEHEALKRLHGVADLFLVHDREIIRHVDDSVVRIVMDRELVLRRARGYAPLPVETAMAFDAPIIAVGAHLKNSIALAKGKNVFVSQHIGDLETKEAMEAFERVNESFKNLYDAEPATVVADMHPDYRSTQFAKSLDAKVIQIQHHYAHVASCMAENHLNGSVLGVSWDGTGYGPDGTIWGGEFLLTDESSFSRVAHLRQCRLPGGDKSIREPRRTAVGLLFEIFGESLFQRLDLHPMKTFRDEELVLLRQMLTKKINSPLTSSAGRLFDAVASLTGLRDIAKFEGQAAMELEWAIGKTLTNEEYVFTTSNSELPLTIDWEPMVLEILEDVRESASPSLISAKFHNTMAAMILEVARRIGEKRVALTGGCFQNKYLLERTVRRLQDEGFRPYWHQRVPPNDGGIALGQIFAAQCKIKANSFDIDESMLTESII
ncbi:MAG: carbamoyltransferase HypF [Bacteroidota bacterium]